MQSNQHNSNAENSSQHPAASISTARRKTGPRTSQGKQRSRQNALKHGLFSGVLLGHESQSQFHSLARGLEDDFMPVRTLESILVEKLCMLLWRYGRLLRVESAILQEQIWTAEELGKEEYEPTDADTGLAVARMGGDADQLKAFARQAVQRAARSKANTLLFQNALPESPRLECLMRYEVNLERAIDRTLSQLERIQRIRLGQNVPPEQQVRVTLQP